MAKLVAGEVTVGRRLAGVSIPGTGGDEEGTGVLLVVVRVDCKHRGFAGRSGATSTSRSVAEVPGASSGRGQTSSKSSCERCAAILA